MHYFEAQLWSKLQSLSARCVVSSGEYHLFLCMLEDLAMPMSTARHRQFNLDVRRSLEQLCFQFASRDVPSIVGLQLLFSVIRKFRISYELSVAIAGL